MDKYQNFVLLNSQAKDAYIKKKYTIYGSRSFNCSNTYITFKKHDSNCHA